MAFIDYYKILGVDKNIPQSDIRKAYKKRAKQFHPDLHPNDPKAKAKFQALNEAYDVLNDPDKRAKYDQYGEHWKQAQGFNGQQAGWGAGNGQGFDFDFSQFTGQGQGFSSFFEDLFGGYTQGGFKTRRTRPQPQPTPSESHITIELSMYEALLGGEKIIQTPHTKLKLKYAPCTQPGTKVRAKGKGDPKGDGTFTDLIITYQVKFPSSLTPKQQELLKQMQAASNS